MADRDRGRGAYGLLHGAPLTLVFAGEPSEEHGPGHESGQLMKGPMAILALLSVVSGLIAVPGVTDVRPVS